ncbi:MAG: adenylyltransferase/cytidyltransferase family protein [Pseudomonadales bacterium]|nr:adenylyltransferase/cytidyltransferase family protein [Pseudomonadales bacterium]
MNLDALSKVVSLENMANIVGSFREGNDRVVALCHGCFDILHTGHLRHFEAAKKKSDLLVVTITEDRFIKKGPNRPVFPAEQRAELLAGLRAVDYVAVNRWANAIETIRLIRPSYFVKGQEYEPTTQKVNSQFFEEEKAINSVGGKVLFTYEFTSSSTMAYKKLTSAVE